tara:strand:- start:560 stop:820 length:261 start_codon:yes stop_codon:yes gene_type:complete
MKKDEEVHFKLEMECGLVADFTPDWRVSENYSDHNQVQWKLQHNADTKYLDDVLIEFSPEESLFESNVSMENLRLLRGYNPGGTDS